MNFHLSTYPAHLDVIVFLVLAALSMSVALRFLRRALAPVVAMVRAITAVAVVAFAIGLALSFVAAATFAVG